MRIVVLILFVGIALAACGAAADPAPPIDPSIPAETPNLEPTQPPADPEVPVGKPPTLDPDLVNPRVEEFDSYLPPRLIGLGGEGLQGIPGSSSYDWAWIDFYPNSEFYSP
jgi:hypothetical protein